MPTISLDIPTPGWARPLLLPKRYKGAKGGRGGGKSWFFADLLIESHVCNPNLQSVCIREVQNTLDTSVKKLIEAKLHTLGVDHLFEPQVNRILDKRGRGLIIFKGMQDYNASNIKSLEGFDLAWVEEAQNFSQRSLQLLRPTIRKDGSEIWFSWNPENDSDPVDKFFAEPRDDAVCVTCNLVDNPFASALLRAEMENDRRLLDLDEFHHVWEGGYRTLSKAQVLAGKVRVDEFTPGPDWDGPYHGADFGFATDPTTLGRWWVHDQRLYLEYESWAVGLELDDTAARWMADVPGCEGYTIRADSARPESISYLRRHGMPHIVGVKKAAGSVEDGVAHLRSYQEIVIHPRCPRAVEEARLWSYKVDRLSGDVLPVLAPGYDHIWDAARYALQPLIRPRRERTQRAHTRPNW